MSFRGTAAPASSIQFYIKATRQGGFVGKLQQSHGLRHCGGRSFSSSNDNTVVSPGSHLGCLMPILCASGKLLLDIFRAARLVFNNHQYHALHLATVVVRISVARPCCCVRSTPSLARSIRKGRGDRTPDTDENKRTTVGVDLLNHKLRNGTECKIYNVAGQVWSPRHDALMFSLARSCR